MITLIGGLGQIFNSAGAGVFGSFDVFALIVVIAIAFFLFYMNLPTVFVFMCTGLVALAFYTQGGIARTLIALSAVILGTLIAFAVWSIFKQGD